MLSVAPWFGAGLTFSRELCYLNVVAFQRKEIIIIIIKLIFIPSKYLVFVNNTFKYLIKYSFIPSLRKTMYETKYDT